MVKEIKDKHGNIKVGKNQIFKDGKSWTVEMFEYKQNGTPMYSVFDAFPTKKQAKRIAKIVNTRNQYRVREKLMKDKRYLAR